MMDISDLSISDILNITDEHKIEVEITNKKKYRENKNHLPPTNQLQIPEMSSASSATPENKIISVSAPQPTQVPQVPVPTKECKECSVCLDLYNKSTRARVTCQSCGYEACRQCYATFILDATNTLPNCMNCHKEFQREFLVDKFTLKFVSKDWKDHRERIIFQKERALLPTRQPVAEMVKRKNDLNTQSNQLLEQINTLRAQHYACLTEKNRLEHRIRIGPAADAALPGAASHREHAAFVRPCPNTAANCRGFLSTQWKCNLCSMWTCKDCHEMKGDAQDTPHVCNADNLASAKLIDAETRACPKCGARVYKISGCNQMFCTACNDCAFDWVTGRIETVIHNPHYYEFQRQLNGGQAPRVPGDILCGREIDNMTTTVITNLFPAESITRNIIVWRNMHKDFANERHVYLHGRVPPPAPAPAPAPAVGGAAAAASSSIPPLTAKDRWDRFYADCVSNTNHLMDEGPTVSAKKQTWAEQIADLLTVPSPDANLSTIRLQERMRIERMILFRKIQLQEICRIIIEIRHVLLPQYHIDPLRYNEDLGVKYLLGELTEQEFATALQRADKRMQKSRDIQNILTMVLTTSTDIIFRFADHLRQNEANKKSYQQVSEQDFAILDEIRELFNYANRCMNVVARTYQSKVTVTLGQTLETKYWEDDGQLIYVKMVEYNRAVGGAHANHYR
jgi:uncharacterized protein YdbL (DUF1318 family)